MFLKIICPCFSVLGHHVRLSWHVHVCFALCIQPLSFALLIITREMCYKRQRRDPFEYVFIYASQRRREAKARFARKTKLRGFLALHLRMATIPCPSLLQGGAAICLACRDSFTASLVPHGNVSSRYRCVQCPQECVDGLIKSNRETLQHIHKSFGEKFNHRLG